MPESFANKSVRRVGVNSTVYTASIGVATDRITNISTYNVAVGALVDAIQFIGGTRITAVNTASNFGTSGVVTVDSTSTNVSAATTQTVGFNSVTSIETPIEKTILVAGTFANNTNSQVRASLILSQANNEHVNIVHNVPIPEGSSLVISDAGKVVVGIGSTLSVAVNGNQAVDVSFSFLKGVT
jgi:hypothetical protein